jgi:hypothetical protein
MPETFLILLAGGALLAAAIPDPRDVTLLWLRLAGIIALSLAGLSAFFWLGRDEPRSVPATWLYVVTIAAVLAELGFTQVARRHTQRAFALLAYATAVATAVLVLPRSFAPRPSSTASVTLALAGVSAMTGIVLMDMLLGHAYLTASKMGMRPFERLNRSLALVATLRLVSATAGVYALNTLHPVRMLWPIHGLFMLTRWLVGLAVPFVFIYMAHDCIKRRATQSATGILYVCGILIFIGELIALPLVRDTGLPF